MSLAGLPLTLTAESETLIAHEECPFKDSPQPREVADAMTLTVATPEDWERVRSARLAALQDSPDAFARTFEEESVHLPSWWMGRLSSDAAITLIADAADPQCIGTLAPYGDHDACGFYGIWVSPESRGSGLSDALIGALIGHARARGIARVLLDVGIQNTPAITLYRRHGFVATGETSCLPWPRTHIQEMQMALDVTQLPQEAR